MYRKLTDQDKEVALKLLNEDRALNVILIGEINMYGFDNEIQFFGEFIQDELVSVIDSFSSISSNYYTNGKGNIEDTIEMITQLEWRELMGLKAHLTPLMDRIPHQRIRDTFLAETKQYDYYTVDEQRVKTVTTEEELEEIFDLYLKIDEFSNLKELPREFFSELNKKIYLTDGNGLKTYLKEDNAIIAVAGAMLENEEVAYIEGVATVPPYRNKGYASITLKHLMNEYKRKNKRLCLHYNNPEAGSIYHRLGFKDTQNVLVLINPAKEETL